MEIKILRRVLNHRVVLHAIDATPARHRNDFVKNCRVHPTHGLISAQVGNTVKRVVIIAAAMVVLGEAMEPVAMVGTTVAIAGVLLYSILKQRLA